MNRYLRVCSLTPAGRPLMEEHESELSVIDDVTVYVGDVRKYRKGVCSISTHNLYWVGKAPSGDPIAFAVHLKHFKREISAKTRLLGLGSAKLILLLCPIRLPDRSLPPPEPGYLKLGMQSHRLEPCLRILQGALVAKDWVQVQEERRFSAKTAGIGGILRRKEEENKEAEMILGTAFKDLNALMEAARDVVRLAKRYAASEGDREDTDQQRIDTVMKDLGAVSTLSRNDAGDRYYDLLARQIVDLVLPKVQKEGGMMSLMDVYCFFNRGRGTSLIAPADLLNACKRMKNLKLPLELYSFQSGLMVLRTLYQHDDHVAASIVRHLSSTTRTTAFEYAQHAHISVALAEQQLTLAERQGHLCRDETLEATWFYKNIFV